MIGMLVMNLVIVESPTKARTITRFLGKDFIIRSSYGHVRDLPKGNLGIDIEHDFQPKYVIPTKARKNVTELKKEAEEADTIILATDEDREGEAIAWHLVQVLGLNAGYQQSAFSPQPNKKTKKPKAESRKPKAAIARIVFHEITQSAIETALKNPRKIDQNLVDAQQARRILDRLVGYKLSPFLWKKVARGLSAGRVQSVAVRLIVEREREIEKFKPEEYWSITALLETSDKKQAISFPAQLIKIGEKTLDKLDINSKEEAEKITNELAGAKYIVQSIDKNEVIRNPSAPFTTSTLQQDAAHKLHFSAKQTMMIAQQLYEGMELGDEGSVGLITYMRTDSVNLSEESLVKSKEYILKEFGDKYLEQRRFKTKSKSAQEAHEAIRPTEPHRTPENIKNYLTPQQFKLYNLIWRRFVASQMAKAVFDATAISISASKTINSKSQIPNHKQLPNSKSEIQNINYIFKATGQTMKFDGFLKIYPMKFTENDLPMAETGEELNLQELKSEQHFTQPPARYNEASLIKTLEKEGIGRPSTYAPTISTIVTRNYVNKDRARYFHPTEIGTLVNDLLVEHFPQVVDIKFTSKMENELDDIADGKVKWIPVIKNFYDPFAVLLKEKYEEVSKEEVTQMEKTGQKCEKCGSDMVIKMGRYGKFVACSNFPTCKNILKDGKPKEEPEKTGEKCDKCGEGEMVIRTGKFGKFIACSNYPKCRNTKKIEQTEKPETDRN